MSSQPTPAFQRFFVSGYTQPSPTLYPQGVSLCALEPTSGAMRVLYTQSSVVNPSYLARRGDYLFAVKETSVADGPAVSTLELTKTGALTLARSADVPGDAPCHLCVDPSGRFLVVATYSSGHVILYEIGPDGVLLERQVIQHQDVQRQDVQQRDSRRPARDPHAHQAVFGPDGATLFVTDLGLDEIRSYRLRAGRLEPQAVTTLKEGSGPRHLAFHPSGDYAFVIGELDASLTLLEHRDGTLTPLASHALLPDSRRGSGDRHAGAAVRVSPSGSFVYASNRDLDARGNDGVTVFSFDAERRTLTRTAFVPSGGHLPRDFALTPDGRLLVVAHQGSNTLVSFWVDEASGKLEPTGETLELHQPVCVLMD